MNFNENDYLDIIKIEITNNQTIHGYKTLMARACGCQKSYLSQVLRGQTHLTMDHAFGLSEFFKFDEMEQEYFLALLQKQRSGSLNFQKYIISKLKEIRKRHKDLSKKFDTKAPTSKAEDLSKYYSNWHYNAIHMICGITDFQSVVTISNRLNLAPNIVEVTLTELSQMGLVKKENSKWINTDNYLHLPKNSPYSRLNHTLWRQKATENSFLGMGEDLNYSAIYTLSKSDIENINSVLRKAIDKTRDIVIESEEEEIVCLNIDYFKI